MPKTTRTTARWQLASTSLLDAYTDFILSRQAANCTPATLEFYRHTAGAFLSWCESQGVTTPAEVTARLVRAFLAGLLAAGRADTTLHANARAIRTLVRFWKAENYIPEIIRFDMPKLEKKRLPVLTAEQLQTILKACSVRDRAIVLFMADSGLRRAEVCALNWEDIDMRSGAVFVARGKGRKPRVSRIGATTRRALLAYRRTIPERDGALFKTPRGTRLTGEGLRLVFRRISKRTGIHVTAHAMRRTFTILALRAGMGELYLMRLLGHASLEMVEYYASLEHDDLLQAHKDHSPIDRLK